MQGRGRALDARSCAYLHQHSTEHAVSYVVGYIKGKSAKGIARQFAGEARTSLGRTSGHAGYFVSTVGLDEEMVRAYIRDQEGEDERYEQLKLRV